MFLYAQQQQKACEENPLIKCVVHLLKKLVTKMIGELVDSTDELRILKEIKTQDVTMIHTGEQALLLDETRLGACKIEKYVIRGIALGAKQYGVYYLEQDKKKCWQMRLAVKLKGVRADARTMDILEDINQNIGYTTGDAPVDTINLPIAVTKMMVKWSRMGAGTILSNMVKMVRPTLTKRQHNHLI